MSCKCGAILHYGDIPSRIEYKFISDAAYDKYEGEIDSEKLYIEMKSFFKCANCKRLWLFWNGFDEKPSEYVPVKD